MQCPACQVELKMTDRQGVEIDYCPRCRGVWLDRGELDKLIERSTEQSSRFPARDEPDHDDERSSRRPGHLRRRSFLGELFDFGD